MATVCSLTEYLYLDQADPWKNEYYHGKMHPVPPISLNENRISTNLLVALTQLLRKRGSAVFAGRMRLHVPVTGSYFFPDVLVTPQPPVTQALPQIPDAAARDICNVHNPVVLVEVVSAESEQQDRTPKLEHYQQIPTLREYLLVYSYRVGVELYFKDEAGRWTLTETSDANEAVTLPSLGVTLTVAELYEDVSLQTV